VSAEAATCGACGRPLMNEAELRHFDNCDYQHCTHAEGKCWEEGSRSCREHSTRQQAAAIAEEIRSLAVVDPASVVAAFSPGAMLNPGGAFKHAWRRLLLEAARILEGEAHGSDLSVSIASFEGEEWPHPYPNVVLRTVLQIDCREGGGLGAEEVVARYGPVLAAAGIDRVRVIELDDEIDVPQHLLPDPAVSKGGPS